MLCGSVWTPCARHSFLYLMGPFGNVVQLSYHHFGHIWHSRVYIASGCRSRNSHRHHPHVR